MRNRLVFFLVTMLFPALNAVADTLPIKGAYGNRDGCAYARTGESTGSENFLLLTGEAITTSASYCTFDKILETKGKSFVAKLSCEAEGEDKPSDFTANITFAAKGYTITFAEDKDVKWGPLPQCK